MDTSTTEASPPATVMVCGGCCSERNQRCWTLHWGTCERCKRLAPMYIDDSAKEATA